MQSIFQRKDYRVMRMKKIRQVSFFKNFLMEVIFTDESVGLYDMSSRLKTVRFYDLNDWEIFKNGYVKDEQVICWENGSELFLDEIIFKL